MTCEKCDIENFHCSACGIVMGLDKSVTALWRENHHSFVCPNGHSLSWDGKSPKDKQVEELTKEVESLKEKLAAAEKRADEQQKRAESLVARLEIWEPEVPKEEISNTTS